MSVDLGGAAAEGWALWRADRAVLIPLAGLFLFVPTLALLLFVGAPPQLAGASPSDAEAALFLSQYRAWFAANAPIFAVSWIATQFGAAAIFAYYLDDARPTLASALTRAALILPRYLLAAVLTAIAVMIGLVMLVLPGLYAAGRLLMVGPTVIAEPGTSAAGAIARALAISRNSGWVFAGTIIIAVIAQNVLPAPLLAIDEALRRAHAANPVPIALVDIGAAALAAAVALGFILFRVGLYRRIA